MIASSRSLFALVLALAGASLFVLAAGCDDTRPGGDAGPGVDTGVPPGTDAGPRPDTGMPPDRDAGPLPMSPLVDPSCTDGMYAEALPNPDGDISGVVFDSSDLVGFYVDVLQPRYPFGATLVRDAPIGGFPQHCAELFAGSPTDFDSAMSRLNTVVHECGHFYDLDLANDGYFINADLTITCSNGDSTDRGGNTFARSRINNDEYSALRPPCDGVRDPGCDTYADIYLNGDPDDGTFDGGDQGFNLLHEETVQYVNSIATGYAYADQVGAGRRVSHRDGILTFLWYTTRYLRMARLEYPDAYAFLSGDACWRNLILTTWGRAWLYLELTADNPSLGINDAAIYELATDPVLVEEIQRLRDLEGCGG